MFKKRLIVFFAVPIVLAILYSGLRFGYINPMVKGIDIHIIGGTFITNINKYVIKVGDEVNISAGNYIVVPEFSKKPTLKFAILDHNDVLSIQGSKLIAKKQGYSSLGILNKNRVLRKVTIMVVNPKINNVSIELSNPLKYYGDKADIIGSVNIDDFKKLEKGYKLNYSVTNKNILKLKENVIEAIGVGETKLISKYDRKEIQTSIKILPKVVKLDVDNQYELEVGQEIKINPEIETLPKGKKSKIEYKTLITKEGSKYNNNKRTVFSDAGLETVYGIDIGQNGSIYANRVGNYLLKVSSGDKNVISVVKVIPKSFQNINIENLQYKYDIKDDLLNLELGWDYNERVNMYQIYIKKGNEDFSLYTTVKTNKKYISQGRRISELVKLELDNNKVYDYKIYVVGTNGYNLTKKSDVIQVNNNIGTSFQNRYIKDLKYTVDEENGTIKFLWKPLDKSKYTYRIYYSDNNIKNSGYRLIAKNIKNTEATVKIDESEIDYNFYLVVVDKNAQISGFSKPVSIKAKFLE